MRNLLTWWKSYKYRLVPWIALNFKSRSIRAVDGLEKDKIVSPEVALCQLRRLCSELDSLFPLSLHLSRTNTCHRGNPVLLNCLGFDLRKKASLLKDGGTGVYITSGHVTKGALVALYPGTIYEPWDPVLLVSINNSFIFRCIDGLLVDGNDRGLSRIMFKSVAGRDQIGPWPCCDMSWLGPSPLNPMNVGQYVNNHAAGVCEPNVAYQEFELSDDWPLPLLRFLPYVFYRSLVENSHRPRMRVVGLVATKDILKGEELYSSYFTVVSSSKSDV